MDAHSFVSSFDRVAKLLCRWYSSAPAIVKVRKEQCKDSWQMCLHHLIGMSFFAESNMSFSGPLHSTEQAAFGRRHLHQPNADLRPRCSHHRPRHGGHSPLNVYWPDLYARDLQTWWPPSPSCFEEPPFIMMHHLDIASSTADHTMLGYDSITEQLLLSCSFRLKRQVTSFRMSSSTSISPPKAWTELIEAAMTSLSLRLATASHHLLWNVLPPPGHGNCP